MNKAKVFYIRDENLISQCDRLPAVINRASMVHSLLTSYDLPKHMKVVRSSPASYEELNKFHTELYLDHLKTINEVEEEYMTSDQDEKFGIGYDCPPVSNMLELVSVIAGGSLTAAKGLILGVGDIAINWCGGWHHAHKSSADGFCYVNDIVLAIEMLRRKFPKILYIDLDVHHGNGVQDAYNSCDAVFTLSIHKFEPGFYPGTGGIDDIGSVDGKGYSANVPLHEGYSDQTLQYVFKPIFEKVFACFCPDAIVVQCGADALSHDPHGGAKLTTRGYCECVQTVLDKRKSTILLGGGGYNHPNTARLWASLTALAAGITLNDNIPEHNNWPQYGPQYTLAVEPSLARDCNKKSYLDECIKSIINNLENNLHIQPKVLEQNKILKRKIDQQVSTATEKENSNHCSKNCTPINQSKPNDIDVYEFKDI